MHAPLGTRLRRYGLAALALCAALIRPQWATAREWLVATPAFLPLLVVAAPLRRPPEPSPLPIAPFRLPLAVFAFCALLVSLFGYYWFDQGKGAIERHQHEQLTAIAAEKAREFAAWRTLHVETIRQVIDRDARTDIRRWLADDAPPPQRLTDTLQALLRTPRYESAFLLDAAGRLRLTLGKAQEPGETLAALARRARDGGEPVIADVRVAGSPVRFDIAAPLGDADGAAVAVLVLRLDPYPYFYESVLRWPVVRSTAEVLLVRRDGRELVFLDRLPASGGERPRPLPPGTPGLLAPAPLQGAPGAVSALDYRGKAVLAVVHPIAATPWALVAKIDRAETIAPIRELAVNATVGSLLLLALAGTSTALWWRRVRSRYLSGWRQQRAERELLSRHYDYLARYANDIILLIDTEGRLVEANDRALEVYGMTREALLQRRWGELTKPGELPILAESAGEERPEALLFEIWQQRADGSVFPAEVSARIIDVDGKSYYQTIIRDISERKRAEEHIHFLAHHDPLTALPNRHLLYERIARALARAKRERTRLALIAIDLDRFKSVNDAFGHPVGDRVLQMVAERLGAAVGIDDVLSRPAGDEFVILLAEVASPSEPAQLAERVLAQTSRPYRIEGREVVVTLSAGIGMYPEDGADADALLRSAEAAMVYAKESGRNNYQFFTPELSARAAEWLALESDLRQAVERGEMFLDYQPQFDIGSGRAVGVEALLRWRHPRRGVIPPERFIPIAEETGHVVALGEWVLREACAQHGRWRKQGLVDLPIAVNISALQFAQKDFEGTVAAILRETAADPACLELELTESVVMRDAEAAIVTLQALKKMGIRLAIDDFGTGYSSLSYLRRLPLDKLKIDRSFVAGIDVNPADRAITASIIELGKNLGLTVIAEGVESDEQLRLLRASHCDAVQGFGLCRPMGAERFAVTAAGGFR